MMVDILHRVGMQNSSPENVYRALTTVEGLSDWWTEDTSGDGSLGGKLEFRFGPGGIDMEVIDAVTDERVTWRVVDGPQEWIGTTIDWRLRQDGEWTIVMFEHAGWKEPVPFMYHCSTKWATFLISLKTLVETGTGVPAPRDVKISDWH